MPVESPSTRTPAKGKPADPADFILARRYRAVIDSGFPCGGTLLDFGCGNGAQTRWFAPHFERTVGVDVSEAQLRAIASVMPTVRSSNATGFGVRYDGMRLPLSDASVDAVISFEVLEHVEDEAQALSEIRRVLRPGGALAMSVPNRWWIFETHGADLPLLPWNRVPFFSWLPKTLHDRWARARIYRRREIVEKLRGVGLEIERSAYITAPMDVVKWPPLRSALRSTVFRSDLTAVPFLATAVLVIARRR